MRLRVNGVCDEFFAHRKRVAELCSLMDGDAFNVNVTIVSLMFINDVIVMSS